METLFNLTQVSHAEEITEYVSSLVYNSKLSDLTIHCFNGKVKCHKVILGGMSPFLRYLFSQEDDVDLFMHEVSIENMKGLLSLLYTGNANLYKKYVYISKTCSYANSKFLLTAVLFSEMSKH